MQIQKSDYFLQLSHQSILRHFKQYASNLCYISVATEPKAAIVICQYLVGEEVENNEMFWSDIHKKEIKSANFKQFLIKHASRQQALQHPFIIQNLPAIRVIPTQRSSIWDATPIHSLLKMCEQFFKQYFAIWSNGHQIERDVKEANHCDNTKRSEAMTSIYSIARASLVAAINELAKARRK